MKKNTVNKLFFIISIACAAAGLVFIILSMLDIGSRSLMIGLLFVACANISNFILLRRAAIEKRNAASSDVTAPDKDGSGK